MMVLARSDFIQYITVGDAFTGEWVDTPHLPNKILSTLDY